MRRHLTYANVMASITVFMALGGVTYAATALPKNSVGTKQIRKKAVTNVKLATNAVTGNKVKDGSLTGKDIKVSTLGKVPLAAAADTVGGATAAQLRLRCPASTFKAFGLCVESKAHGTPVSYSAARQTCSDLGGRPPTWWELDAIRQMSGIEWAAGSGGNQYEWSSTLHDIVSPPKVVALDQAGNYINGDNTNTFRFRCVLQPTDG